MTLSKARAKQLTRRVLEASTLEDVQVYLRAGTRGNTRFAVNQPTTTGDVEDLEISVTASVDGRSATVTGNTREQQSIERLVKQAEELARIAPVDPESMPPLGPQRYPRVDATSAKAARFDSDDRADVVKRAIEVAGSHKLEVAGLVTHADEASALANKNGLFAYFPSTEVSLTSTCRTPDGTGSGRAGYVSHEAAPLDTRKLVERAAEKAERSRNPQAIDPGDYTVILEPQAVADLLSFLAWSLSKRAADEGRSYFSAQGGGTRIGEKLFDPRIELWSDPADPDHPSSPIGQDGIPRTKTTWIEDGVLKNLVNSRYWAKTHGGTVVPFPGSLFLAGEDATVDELIKDVKRGILVTRFWYNRMLEPRTILVTGLTRDGTFMVENGKITHAVKNMRYNESPITLLKNVIALGRPERAGMDRGTVKVVPPMVVENFHFSSTSDAV